MRNKQLLQKIYEQQAEILENQEVLEREYELIKAVLMVKEPGTQLAAESFDGLRKQIIAAQGERRSHLSKIVEIAVAVERGGGDDLGVRVEEWLNAADIFRLNDLASVGSEKAHFFQSLDGSALSVDEWSDPRLQVIEAAFIDGNTQGVLRKGRVEFVEAPPQPPVLQPQPIDAGGSPADLSIGTVNGLVVPEAPVDPVPVIAEPQTDVPTEQTVEDESAAETDLGLLMDSTGENQAKAQAASEGVIGGGGL
jgi:hypothetical protein